MKKVIFACVHNAGRSQMAAAFFNAFTDPTVARAISVGTQPADKVHPVVADVMHEIGIDLSNAKPTKLTEDVTRGASLLVTMGCGEQCPFAPGLRVEDWPLPDPKGKPLEEVRAIRDKIKSHIEDLLQRI